jgi:cell division protein FtsL
VLQRGYDETMRPKGKQAGNNQVKATRKNNLTFGFFIFVCIFLAMTGIYILAQHQFTLNNQIKISRLDEKIAKEKAVQKTLRVKLARLQSPARVERIARDILGMSDPNSIIYLRIEKGSNVRIVSKSKCDNLRIQNKETKTVSMDEEGFATLSRR